MSDLLTPEEIVAKEVARQAEFGMEPSWEDFVIAGMEESKSQLAKVQEHKLDRIGWRDKIKAVLTKMEKDSVSKHGLHGYMVTNYAKEILALFPDGELPECGLCGGPMSENPHPEAGKPASLLTVGAAYSCIPCRQTALHGWAERATRAEGQLEQRLDRVKLREELAQELYGIYIADPGNNHLECKEWVLLCEARTKADQILTLLPDGGEAAAAQSIIYAQASERAAMGLKVKWQEEARREEREKILGKGGKTE